MQQPGSVDILGRGLSRVAEPGAKTGLSRLGNENGHDGAAMDPKLDRSRRSSTGLTSATATRRRNVTRPSQERAGSELDQPL